MFRTTVAASLAVLALAGCSGTAEPAVDPQPTHTLVARPLKTQFYLSYMRTLPHADKVSDQQWLKVGRSICRAIDKGAHPMSVVAEGMSQGLVPKQAGLVEGYAIYSLCPQHQRGLNKLSTQIHTKDFLYWKRTGEMSPWQKLDPVS